MRSAPVSGDINVVAIVKGQERYVFMFDDNSRAETLRLLGQYASDPELSFSWYDAAVLSQKVRRTKPSQPASPNTGTNRIDASIFIEDEESFNDFPAIGDLPPIDDMWIGDEPIG